MSEDNLPKRPLRVIFAIESIQTALTGPPLEADELTSTFSFTLDSERFMMLAGTGAAGQERTWQLAHIDTTIC